MCLSNNHCNKKNRKQKLEVIISVSIDFSDLLQGCFNQIFVIIYSSHPFFSYTLFLGIDLTHKPSQVYFIPHLLNRCVFYTSVL